MKPSDSYLKKKVNYSRKPIHSTPLLIKASCPAQAANKGRCFGDCGLLPAKYTYTQNTGEEGEVNPQDGKDANSDTYSKKIVSYSRKPVHPTPEMIKASYQQKGKMLQSLWFIANKTVRVPVFFQIPFPKSFTSAFTFQSFPFPTFECQPQHQLGIPSLYALLLILKLKNFPHKFGSRTIISSFGKRGSGSQRWMENTLENLSLKFLFLNCPHK